MTTIEERNKSIQDACLEALRESEDAEVISPKLMYLVKKISTQRAPTARASHLRAVRVALEPLVKRGVLRTFVKRKKYTLNGIPSEGRVSVYKRGPKWPE